MPIYEYVCESCGEECEILQKISEPDPNKCPSCGASSLRKKISAAGFRLQGSGWYETDFKTANRRNLAGEKDKSKDAGGESSDKNDKSAKGGDAATQSQASDATKGGAKTSAKPAATPSPTVSKSSNASSGSSKTTGATD